ncbi:apolipoprotein acyltransferase [Aquicoccus sp. SCR17]|nr:apolipoprotein acyltransferase [Carideicomes alvinocaridis]
MIVILAGLLGAALGALNAKRRGGRVPDMLQYAAGYGVAFAIIGLIITIAIDRTMV